jgi:hypothetical protein
MFCKTRNLYRIQRRGIKSYPSPLMFLKCTTPTRQTANTTGTKWKRVFPRKDYAMHSHWIMRVLIFKSTISIMALSRGQHVSRLSIFTEHFNKEWKTTKHRQILKESVYTWLNSSVTQHTWRCIVRMALEYFKNRITHNHKRFNFHAKQKFGTV